MDAAGESGRNSAVHHASAAQSIARILREYRDIQRNVSPHWTAGPLSLEEPREWHFTLRGPPDSPFEGGLYHGRIVLPKNYPFGPPSLMLLTRNGRFEVNKKICLSASSHHPELWQPAWGIRTLLDALCAFFPTPAQGALHALDASEKDRRQLALESAAWSCPVCKRPNRQLVEEGCSAPSDSLPELPQPLRVQTLLARALDTPEKKAEGAKGEQEAKAAKATKFPKVAQNEESWRSAAASTNDSAASSGGFFSSSSSSSSSRSAAGGGVERASTVTRGRTGRASRSLGSQLLRIPTDRTELVIAIADFVLLVLVLASLLLLADLVLQPPCFTIFKPSPSLSS